MFPRRITRKLLELAGFYPVVVVSGPWQAGKTTLCRAAFPDKAYVSLESLDTREFAQTDPRGFLAEYRDGAIIDEIQQAPDLASYLQAEVDQRPEPGRYILTGSPTTPPPMCSAMSARCSMSATFSPFPGS